MTKEQRELLIRELHDGLVGRPVFRDAIRAALADLDTAREALEKVHRLRSIDYGPASMAVEAIKGACDMSGEALAKLGAK